jgi:hypothetical protein
MRIESINRPTVGKWYFMFEFTCHNSLTIRFTPRIYLFLFKLIKIPPEGEDVQKTDYKGIMWDIHLPMPDVWSYKKLEIMGFKISFSYPHIFKRWHY